MIRAVLAAAVLVAVTPARAVSGPAGELTAPAHDLRVRALPPPTTLRMRRWQAVCEGASCRPARVVAARDDGDDADRARLPPRTGPGELARGGQLTDEAPALDAQRRRRLGRGLAMFLGDQPLLDRTIFRFNIGMGFDGRQPHDVNTRLDGLGFDASQYARLRVYYFGDAILGSRGIGVPSLSTYFAAQFRFDQEMNRTTSAVPSIHDAVIAGRAVRDLWFRSAYGESAGFFEHPLLKPVYVRLGRQYRYGPAVAHFDGLTLGYDSPALSVGIYGGRVADMIGFPVDEFANAGGIAGMDLRLDLHEHSALPVVLSGGYLRFDARSHVEGNLALRWNRDISLSAGVRAIDGTTARTSLQVRARVSEVTTVNVAVENRSASDWMYDLSLIAPVRDDSLRARLDLGAPVPRMYIDLRAGTVLLDNVDVLVRGGAALRRDRAELQAVSPHAASYIEGGTAIEVRLRRALGLGLSILSRRYEREAPPRPDGEGMDVPGPIDALPGAAGETSFLEGGGTIRYTLGARKFSASTEVYVRHYDFQSSYGDLPEHLRDILDGHTHGGGRFGLEAWLGERIRLKGEYDASTALRLAPELRGIKSMRILAEGRF